MMKKPLAIGVDNYKDMIDKEYYYVDKTLLIKELLDKKGSVNLFTRPRRFGKSLALSMIRTFFECEIDREGNQVDHSRYFAGKKIMDAGEQYTKQMGQFPVIFMSLKSAKQPTFEMAYSSLVDEISREYERHDYILHSDKITEFNKNKFLAIRDRRADAIDYAKAFAFLSYVLELYHGQKTIILIDEYDVPLENSYFRGFYTEMVDFIRSLFESALKTNESLEFAVVTGCLRISKESIFTGLNNLKIVSILNDTYAEYYGFTEAEVKAMLDFYSISDRIEEVKRWYDGYVFGKTEVYNPWSIIYYVDDITDENTIYPKPYWSNTSSNSIIHEMVEQAGGKEKQELETLMAGGTIEKPIHEEITYQDIHKTQDNLWNFLFFTGYLKIVSQRFQGDTIYLTMKIPNAEVGYIYRNTIKDWFDQMVKTADKTPFQQAVVTGNQAEMEQILRRQLMESISFYDSNESFYHGFLVGMLNDVSEYVMRSNRESGDGRADIQLVPFDLKVPAIIIEVKHTKQYSDMEEKCEEALTQIEDLHYDAELALEGYLTFIHYGICFCKKTCKVVKK